MAKTKWIVPAVALMLCAVSLIGAGYAAYSATLTDNETITADNNYITLTLGETAFANKEIDLFYEETTTYENGANPPTYTYKPYASRDDSTNVIPLGKINVVADKTKAASEGDTTTFELEIGTLTYTGQSLTGATVKLYSDAACTTEIQDTTALNYGAQDYYLGFYYVHNDADNRVSAPGETFEIEYTLTATANITNA